MSVVSVTSKNRNGNRAFARSHWSVGPLTMPGATAINVRKKHGEVVKLSQKLTLNKDAPKYARIQLAGPGGPVLTHANRTFTPNGDSYTFLMEYTIPNGTPLGDMIMTAYLDQMNQASTAGSSVLATIAATSFTVDVHL